MNENILVAVDGSEHALRAVDFASNIAAKYRAKLTIFHVMRKAGRAIVPEGLCQLARIEHIEVTEKELLRSAANELVAQARARAAQHGLHDPATVIEVGDPTTTIVDFAKAHGIDLIVLGSRGLDNLKGLLLGSVSHKVAHLAPCTCVTVR